MMESAIDRQTSSSNVTMWNKNASFTNVYIVLHNVVIYYSNVYSVAYLLLKPHLLTAVAGG